MRTNHRTKPSAWVMRRMVVCQVAATALALCASVSWAQMVKIPKKKPFVPGEKLKYKLVWNGIPVGYFTVDVKPMAKVNGKKAWHFYMEVKTNAFADKIYKVRNYVTSYTLPDVSSSLKYEMNQRQGSKRSKVLLEFDWTKSKSRYVLNDKDQGWKKLPGPCVDPLAMFYALRVKELSVLKGEATVSVCDGEKHINSKVKILRREMIKAGGKTYRTILLEPDLRGIVGVFTKSKDAKMQIWVSDDDYKIPVKVSSKVLVGKFYARLMEFKNPQE